MGNHNIIFHVTRQYMKLNKKRTFTTLAGIVFMVLLMTCVFVGKDTALSYLEQVAAANSGSWHVSIYDIDASQYEKLQALSYMDKMAVSKNYGYSRFSQSANEECSLLHVKGYSQDCFEWMNIKLKSGRFPKNSSEIVISEQALLDGAKIAVGDKIELDCFLRYFKGTNGEAIKMPEEFLYFDDYQDFVESYESTGCKGTFTVVGIIQAPFYESTDSAGYTAITYMDNNMPDEGKANVTTILQLDMLDGAYSYMSDFEDIAGSYDNMECNDMLLAFSANSSDSTINAIADFLMLFFSIFIMAASVILIYNVFNLSFDERSRYLGMISSVGATRKQRRSSVYYEAFSLWIVALPIGILAGAGLIKLVMSVLQPHIERMVSYSGMGFIDTSSVPLRISPKSIFLILTVSAVTVIVSAWIPAYKIGKNGPIESIRGNAQKKTKSKTIVRAIAVFMIILSVTAFGTNAVIKMVHERLVDTAIADLAEKWDYELLENPGTAQIYEALKEEIMSDEGIEATRELAYFSMAGVTNDVLSQEYWNARRNIAEAYLPQLTEEEFQDMISENYNRIACVGVDDKTFEEIVEKSECDKNLLSDSRKPGVLVYQNAEISTESDDLYIEGSRPVSYQIFQLEHITDKKIGDTIPLQYFSVKTQNLEKFPVNIAGFATSNSVPEDIPLMSEGMCLIVKMDTLEQLGACLSSDTSIPGGEQDRVFLRELVIRLSGTETRLVQKLNTLSEQQTESFLVLKLVKKEALTTVSEAIVYIIKIIAASFVFLTFAICILNLYNSILGRAAARRQEIAILKSIGMTRKQMKRMLFYENIGLLLKGALWSCVLSVPLIYGLEHILSGFLGKMKFSFPWQIYLGAWIIVAISLVWITAYCYGKRTNESILEGLRRETV